MQRLFAPIAIDTLEAQLAAWAQQVLVALPPPDAATLDGVPMDGTKLQQGKKEGEKLATTGVT